MGWFDEGREAHDQVYVQDPDNQASFGHELLAGAASFGAMKMFEDRQERKGEAVNHKFAKELLAGIAGAEADKLAETYGKNEVQKLEMRHEAKKRAENMYDEHYGGQDQYDPGYGRHEQINSVQETRYYTQDQWN